MHTEEDDGKDSMAFGGVTLSQTVFQYTFAAPGDDNRNILAETKLVDPDWRFSFKNYGGTEKFPLPGFRAFVPAVIDFGALTPDDLWVELKVQFDIRVRYGGWAQVEPEGTIEFSQWTANPL